MKKELQNEIDIFKEYIFKSRWYIIIASCLLLIVYGAWLFNSNPRIDTEIVVNYPNITYNWLTIGRQGLILTEYVFGLRWFNPYVSTSFGYILICIAGVLFGYLLWRCERTLCSGICASFGLLFFSSPIFVEQFYFDIQMFQIAWAFILCALGVGFSYFGILRNSVIMKIVSVLCMIWEFSSYQEFVILHITVVAFCYVLLCRNWNTNNMQGVSKQKYWMLLKWQIGLFLCAMIINTIITKQFFSGSEYLDGKILWGKGDWTYCIRAIAGQIYRGYIGADTFYTAFYGIISVLVMIFSFLYLLKCKALNMRWLYFMAMVFIQCCPFLLTMYMGDTPTIRSQFVYPFVMAGNLVLLSGYCKREWMKKVIVLLAICIVWSQSKVSMRLIYSQEICEQEDIRLAGYIEQRIHEVSSEEKPIAFIGVYSNQLNAACIRGELIGTSIFACDYFLEPHYLSSTSRACNLSRTLGFPFTEVTEEQMIKARKLALELPVWPEQGSVVDAGDFIIVKLGEDEWSQEVK